MAEEETATVTKARRVRKQFEQEASLLENSVKLLQSEEIHTRKLIDRLKKKAELVLEVKEERDRNKEHFEKIRNQREKAKEDARLRLCELRLQRTVERQRHRQQLLTMKRDLCSSVRAEEERARTMRETLAKVTEERNRKRYLDAKSEAKSEKRKESRRTGPRSSKQYSEELYSEQVDISAKERAVRRMEQLELELTNKLIYAQMQEREAMVQLDKAAKGSGET